jgi:hypothetical protein
VRVEDGEVVVHRDVTVSWPRAEGRPKAGASVTFEGRVVGVITEIHTTPEAVVARVAVGNEAAYRALVGAGPRGPIAGESPYRRPKQEARQMRDLLASCLNRWHRALHDRPVCPECGERWTVIGPQTVLD